MNRPFPRCRALAIGVLGLVVAVAVPLVAMPLVADAHLTEGAVVIQAEPQPARTIVYGTATETTVTVYRQSLPVGTPAPLFSYENLDLGDHQRVLPAPELALAPDGRSVAYFARSGLRVCHLDTGADEVVLGRSERPTGGSGPGGPIWTIPELNPPADQDPEGFYTPGMLSLGDIAFSPDGRFLSFAGGWYEYGDHHVIEISTGRHWDDEGSADLAWSPSSNRVAVAGPSYADPGELAVSTPGDFGNYERLHPVPPSAELDYEDVEFAPDGDRIAFAYQTDWPTNWATHLATSNLVGTGFTELHTTGATEAFAFAGDGGSLYSVERRADRPVLVAHDLAGRASRDVAQLPADFGTISDLSVTAAGDLAVIGETSGKQWGTFSQRMLLFAPDGRLLATTPSFDHTTRLVGID